MVYLHLASMVFLAASMDDLLGLVASLVFHTSYPTDMFHVFVNAWKLVCGELHITSLLASAKMLPSESLKMWSIVMTIPLHCCWFPRVASYGTAVIITFLLHGRICLWLTSSQVRHFTWICLLQLHTGDIAN